MPHAASCAPSADHNFIIDLTSEVPNIFVDPNSGLRDIYLQVHSFAGGSENGYEFWAGPPRSADSSYDTYFTVPAQMNARQVYLQSANTMGGPKRIHDSNGISVYGLGHLPMNSDVEEEVDVPLAYLGPEFAGQQLSIDMFDPDSGAKDPIIFYFDTIPTSDWVVCFDDNDDGTSWSNCPDEGYTRQGPANVQSANGEWSAPFVFNIPSDGSGQPFYGGRLVARYHAGGQDTFGWRIVLESRPYLVR
jgi:hypothetical protein